MSKLLEFFVGIAGGFFIFIGTVFFSFLIFTTDLTTGKDCGKSAPMIVGFFIFLIVILTCFFLSRKWKWFAIGVGFLPAVGLLIALLLWGVEILSWLALGSKLPLNLGIPCVLG